MTVLPDATPEERELIVGLPYRVGVWIASAEDEGGETDDAREAHALEKIIAAAAKSANAPPFVSAVMQETLINKKSWPVWAEQSFDIFPDCKKAVMLLQGHVSAPELRAYKVALMRVATSVAGAHGEFGAGEEETGLFGKVVAGLSALAGGRKENSSFMNVSSAEESALSDLASTLGLKKKSKAGG